MELKKIREIRYFELTEQMFFSTDLLKHKYGLTPVFCQLKYFGPNLGKTHSVKPQSGRLSVNIAITFYLHAVRLLIEALDIRFRCATTLAKLSSSSINTTADNGLHLPRDTRFL